MAPRNRYSAYFMFALFSTVVGAGNTRDVNEESVPNLFRAVDLIGSTLMFQMTTSSVNYDGYFFTPALGAFDLYETQKQGLKETYDKFVNFLATDFTIERHAPDFEFSDTETRAQFLTRFLQYLHSSAAVPQEVKLEIEQLEPYVNTVKHRQDITGFIKPLPIYIFLRMTTLLGELDYRLHKIDEDGHIDSVETIVRFLTKDFEASVNGIGLDLNSGTVNDFAVTAYFGFNHRQKSSDPIILTDGVPASTANKNFFEHILPTVPEDVKAAINVVLPYLLI